MNESIQHPSTKIILFDGVCTFCNSAVQFILQRDKVGQFHYASLQSDVGQTYLKQHGLSTTDFNTMVLIDGDNAYTKSTAALHIAQHLDGGLWWITRYFLFIPKVIRNTVYTIVAKNRYRIWGKQDEACHIPSPEVRKRFLS